jgi:uncharacterized oligopeptide transporter (OPT) family protein
VCIAISNAGTCSQDLTTGVLVGSTPVKQQGALLIGVLTSVLAVGWTAYLLNLAETREYPVAQPFVVAPELRADAETVESLTDQKTYQFVRLQHDQTPAGAEPGIYLVGAADGQAHYLREDGIGAGRLQAPQAKLMSVVIDGLLTHKLPWDLILIGAAIAVFIELLGFRSLTFAVGVYLPISSTMPVFLGGLVRKLADRTYRREPDAEDESQGILYCSGLIAGASILGIAAAMLGFLPGFDRDTGYHPTVAFLQHLPFGLAESDLFGVAVIALLGFLMWRGAAEPKQR